MWNPLKKFGQWFDSASNALAQSQLSSGGPISADDLTPQQKRAYLGMLISSLGSGLSALGAGAVPNVMGNYMAGAAALNERFTDQIRRQKLQEILKSDMPIEQKVLQAVSYGDLDTAKLLQERWLRERQEETERNRPVATFQGVHPETGKPTTFAVFPGGRVYPLGTPLVPYTPLNLGDKVRQVPQVGPPDQNTSYTVNLSPAERLRAEEAEKARQQRADEFNKTFGLNVLNYLLNKQLTDARIAALKSPPTKESQTEEEALQKVLMKAPEGVKSAVSQYMSVVNGLDKLYADIKENGKYTIADLLGQTPRGRAAATLINTTIELMKGPFGTGVLQEHEAERLKKILGELDSFKSLVVPLDAQLASLEEIRRIMRGNFKNYLGVLVGNLPPEVLGEFMRNQGEGQLNQDSVKLYKGPDGKYYLREGDNDKR